MEPRRKPLSTGPASSSPAHCRTIMKSLLMQTGCPEDISSTATTLLDRMIARPTPTNSGGALTPPFGTYATLTTKVPDAVFSPFRGAFQPEFSEPCFTGATRADFIFARSKRTNGQRCFLVSPLEDSALDRKSTR